MYDRDVSNEEWDLIKDFFNPVDNRGGAGAKHAKRDIVTLSYT
jgi:hypothetical protein